MIEFGLLSLGLIGLWLGSSLVIKGALNISEHYKVSHIFIGLTILALGTDLPELTIDIAGAISRLKGIETSDLIIGHTIGTCFAQIGLALAIATFFGTVYITKRQLLRDGLMMVASVILLFLVCLSGNISKTEGIIFMLIYLIYFLSLYREEKLYEKIKTAPKMQLTWSIISLLGGFTIIIFCSNLTVDNALLLSNKFNISQSLIGILIVGLGTSLPEIAVSISAMRNNASTMAIGNLIGSNIFDILFTLGVSSTIAPLKINKDLLTFDIPALFFFSIIVLLFFKKEMKLGKKGAIIILILYFSYITFKISYQ